MENNQVDVILQNVSYKRNNRMLLNDVSTTFYSKRLSLIVSIESESCAKLFRILSGTNKNDSGNVSYHPLNTHSHDINIGFVSKESLFYDTLSPYELLLFYANMYHSRMKPQEKRILVKYLINKLHINEPYKHASIIGELSHIDKKLLMIGIEMIQNPSVLLLEQPTNCLNSYYAKYLLHTLKSLTEENMTIIVELSSVPNQFLRLFDDITFLSNGTLIYTGKVSSLSYYMEDIGYTIDSTYEIVEYITLLHQNPHIHVFFNESWESQIQQRNYYAFEREILTSYQQMDDNIIYHSSKLNCFSQMNYLFLREIKHFLCSEKQNIFHFGLILLFNLFTGVVFENIAYFQFNTNIENWNSIRFTILVFCVIFNVILYSFPYIFTFSFEQKVIQKEIRLYNVWIYMITKTIIDIWKHVIFACITVGISVCLLQFYGNFIYFILEYTLLGLVFSTFSMLLSLFSIELSIALYSGCVFSQVYFTGLFVPVSATFVYFHFLYYVCFMNYGISAIVIEEFEAIPSNFPTNLLDSYYKSVFGCTYKNSSKYICDHISNEYAIFPYNNIEADHKWSYMIVLGVIFIFLRCFLCLSLHIKANYFSDI